MTIADFTPGDVVRVNPNANYNAGSWGNVDLTVRDRPTFARPNYTYLSHPNYDYAGAIQTQYLMPVLQEGDVVNHRDFDFVDDPTVAKLTKKGNAVVEFSNGERVKYPLGELRLVRRRPSPDEVIAKKDEEIADLTARSMLLQRQQTAAQYANDQQLMKAGLVRVELLAQWDAVLTPRKGETSLALLSQLRDTIATAEKRTR